MWEGGELTSRPLSPAPARWEAPLHVQRWGGTSLRRRAASVWGRQSYRREKDASPGELKTELTLDEEVTTKRTVHFTSPKCGHFRPPVSSDPHI